MTFKMNVDNVKEIYVAMTKAKEELDLMTPEFCQKNNLGKDPNKYHRWMMFGHCTRTYLPKHYVVDELYTQDLNDDHIDSVLKYIQKELWELV